GPLRPQALDPADRLANAEVAGMRDRAQGIENPHIEPLQERNRRLRQAADVGRVGEAADAKAERGDIAVILQDRGGLDHATGAGDVHGLWRIDVVGLEDRRIAAAEWGLEAVGEASDEAVA